MPSDTPSDERVLQGLKTVSSAAEAFRSAVVAATEDVRGLLGTRERGAGESASRLGVFGESRIDTARFAQAVRRVRPFDAKAIETLRRCFDALRSTAFTAGEELFTVQVSDGGTFGPSIERGFARLGSAFAAARAAAALRDGRAVQTVPGAPFPYSLWSRRERRFAPPLVVDVDGADLRAAELAPYLDGSQKVLVLVRGACAPAPLARLITPGVFVLQTDGKEAIDAFRSFAGPAVAAIVPEGAALFVHDPSAGASTWERVKLLRPPAAGPRKPLGGLSAEQQDEELRQLLVLATVPSAPLSAGATDATSKLAAWLLGAAEVSS